MSATEAVLLCGHSKSDDKEAVLPWDECESCRPQTIERPVGLTMLKAEHYTPYTKDYFTKEALDSLKAYCLRPQSRFWQVFNELYRPREPRPPYKELQSDSRHPKKQLLVALCQDVRHGTWGSKFESLFKKYRFWATDTGENWFLSMIFHQIYTNYRRGREQSSVAEVTATSHPPESQR